MKSELKFVEESCFGEQPSDRIERLEINTSMGSVEVQFGEKKLYCEQTVQADEDIAQAIHDLAFAIKQGKNFVVEYDNKDVNLKIHICGMNKQNTRLA